MCGNATHVRVRDPAYRGQREKGRLRYEEPRAGEEVRYLEG